MKQKKKTNSSLNFLGYVCLLVMLSMRSFFSFAYEPQPYLATYKMKWDIGITLSASATERFFKDNKNYVMELFAEGSIGSSEEKTTMLLSENGWDPISYQKIQKVLGREKSKHFLFDQEMKIIEIKNDNQISKIPLTKGTLDPLSFRAELAYHFFNKKNLDKPLNFLILEGENIRTRRLVEIGNELISIPYGNIDTVKLELVDNHSTEKKYFGIWLSPELDYKMVKLKQIKNNRRLLLELSNYTENL